MLHSVRGAVLLGAVSIFIFIIWEHSDFTSQVSDMDTHIVSDREMYQYPDGKLLDLQPMKLNLLVWRQWKLSIPHKAWQW